MIKVRYEHMKFYYITNHYDFHLEGYCWWEGKLAKFVSRDETDYQTMNDTCPYCSDQTTDMNKCHCQNAPDVFCYIEKLSFRDRIKAWYHVNVESKLYFIRHWGLRGIFYWNNWKYK